MRLIESFYGFITLNEGGAAIKSSRSIREDEFPGTFDSIKSVLLPILGISEDSKDYLVIGSIGKKPNPDDVSGDLDLGFEWEESAKVLGGSSKKDVLANLYEKLKTELPEALGFDPEMNLMVGLNILSVGWPIKGDPKNGVVQLDLIPLSDLEWANFAYYSPDYRKGESKYKSAHRNWLFQAILSSMKDVITKDENGEPLDIDTYVFDFSDGLFKTRKTFQGKKGRLKNPVKVDGVPRELVSNNPQEFLNFAMGPGFNPDEVKTFEDLLKAIQSPKFRDKQNRAEIREEFKRYLERTPLIMPSEIETLK
jgi:hypothetical protein